MHAMYQKVHQRFYVSIHCFYCKCVYPLIRNRFKLLLTCAFVYLDLGTAGTTAGTSTGTHSESAPPEQPEPIQSSVSDVSNASGRVLTLAVLEPQQQIVRAIGEINSHWKNVIDALIEISNSLKELVKK